MKTERVKDQFRQLLFSNMRGHYHKNKGMITTLNNREGDNKKED